MNDRKELNSGSEHGKLCERLRRIEQVRTETGVFAPAVAVYQAADTIESLQRGLEYERGVSKTLNTQVIALKAEVERLRGLGR